MWSKVIVMVALTMVRLPNPIEQESLREKCEEVADTKMKARILMFNEVEATIWRLCSAQRDSTDPLCLKVGDWYNSMFGADVEECMERMDV